MSEDQICEYFMNYSIVQMYMCKIKTYENHTALFLSPKVMIIYVDESIFIFQDEEIKSNVANYLPEISEILNSVPREMLLIFKTNDLIRGIETTLKTRSSARSFITMSKCCVKALAHHRRKQCTTWWCRVRVIIHEQWQLLLISLYIVYLWAESSSLGKKVTHFRASVTSS